MCGVNMSTLHSASIRSKRHDITMIEIEIDESAMISDITKFKYIGIHFAKTYSCTGTIVFNICIHISSDSFRSRVSRSVSSGTPCAWSTSTSACECDSVCLLASQLFVYGCVCVCLFVCVFGCWCVCLLCGCVWVSGDVCLPM